MQTISEQHCLNHPVREAVARCPECKQFYCRECITEHDDRVICAACLRAMLKPSAQKKFNSVGLARIFLCGFGLVTAWLFFYWIGQGLLAIPTKFHEGTIWKTGFWEE